MMTLKTVKSLRLLKTIKNHARVVVPQERILIGKNGVVICCENATEMGTDLDEPVELFCTYDADDNEWLVWFPHPLGGRDVLGSFASEIDARKFWKEQIDSSDFG
jgi:hypothetical protein